MNMPELEREFSRMETLLDAMKARAEEISARTVLSKGPYFELPIFSYQRGGWQQGRLLESLNRFKKYGDIYRYTFDKSERLIRKEDGNDLNQFGNTFYFYDTAGHLCLSYYYDDLECPANVTSHHFVGGKLQSSESFGLYGTRSEKYFYNDDLLNKIIVFAREHDEETTSELPEYFYYDDARILDRIEINYPIGDPQIIYKRKKQQQTAAR